VTTYIFIDYVQRSSSSLYRRLRYRNCPNYITLHYITSREQRGPVRLKLAEVAHVTRDSDHHFQGQNIKVTGGRGHTVAASHTACYLKISNYCIYSKLNLRSIYHRF